MEVIYRACDGKEFSDEFECEYYEQCLKWDKLLAESDFSVCDEYNKPMVINFHNYTDVEDAYNYSYYVTIRNEAASKLMEEINDYFGIYFPTEIGEYKFVGDCCGQWEKM